MALVFDGSDDYLYTARPFDDRDNWTLAAWVNYPSLSRAFSIDLYSGEDGSPGQYNGYGFGLGGDNGGTGSKLVGLFGGVAWKNSGYTFSSANTWYHVVMTRNSGTLKFYVNGSDVGYSNTDGPQGVNYDLGKFSVCAQDRNGESGVDANGMKWWANTRMAEVAAWQRALSVGEIAALGKGFAPSFFKSSLLLYLPLINSSHKIEVARGASITTGDAPTTYAHPRIYYPNNYGLAPFSDAVSTSVKDIIGMGFIPFAR